MITLVKKNPLIAWLLLLSLTGCNFLQQRVISQAFQSRRSVLSDIPTSNLPCVNAQSFHQPELSVRQAITSQSATAFSSESFGDLEEFYNVYRERTSRTPSGRWKLQFFYNGIFENELPQGKTEELPEVEKQWTKVESKLRRWMNAYPNSPAPYIAYSSFLYKRAWYLRGGAFAKDTSPQAFDLFDKNIELERSLLERSKEIASTDPQWYANMLEVAQAQAWSKEDFRSLLHEALSKEAYYQETYHAAFSYLLPKWHGSFEEAEQFANDAVAITSKCDGRSMYARIYLRAFNSEAEFATDPFQYNQVSWQKMNAGFDDLIQRYPEPLNVNHYAKFACLAGDKPKAKELLSRIGGKPIREAWGEDGIDFDRCQKWAFNP